MTARERILAAFTPTGTPEVGVVSCYDGIFVRDHWHALTDVPWWYAGSGIMEHELAWARDVSERSGLEWLQVGSCPSREERRRFRYDRRADSVWRIDEATGQQTRLMEPTPGGVNTACASDQHVEPESLPATRKEVDAMIPESPPFDRDRFLAEGRHDVVAAFRERFDLLLYAHVSSPLWSLYGVLGYEGMMMWVAERPDLAAYAAQRSLNNTRQRVAKLAALGMDAVWIEECITDQISPEAFSEINVPLMQACVSEIRSVGLRSIYYYCGSPHDRLDAILKIGADAVHFEEGKKGFTIDIEDMAARIDGRCTLFGNLDSIGVLQDGSEPDLEAAIRRQLKAAARNKGRFVMSTGSPITPGTPVSRVRLYTDLVRRSC